MTDNQVQDLCNYWRELKYHDWDYNYSDDHAVWQRGFDKERHLSKLAETSEAHRQLYQGFRNHANDSLLTPEPPFPLEFFCDKQRHLICKPYSTSNLHIMAAHLGIKRSWFHKAKFPHYDMPKKRVDELTAKCTLVPQSTILKIIKEAANGQGS